MLRIPSIVLATALSAVALAFALSATAGIPRARADAPLFTLAGRYATGLGELSGETVAYHQNRLFVTNSADNSLDIVDIANPAAPLLVKRVSLAPWGAGPNSVDVYKGTVVVAMEADPRTDPGQVAFFDRNGFAFGAVAVGALPDMLSFTPDGRKVIVANEGEPSSYSQADSVDPEGSISILTLNFLAGSRPSSWIPASVQTVHFRDFNLGGSRHAELPAGIRIFGPNASVAQDLEPESVAIAADSKTAWVTLQENNALAEIDIAKRRVTAIRALGLKDHLASGQGLDASDRDSAITIANWPVKGMYQPDAIERITVGGTTYLVTANEGDARDYTGFAEEIRVGSGSYVLDAGAFPNAATLKQNAQLGRLTVSRATGDTDNDGQFEEIQVFGARSFSIWNAATGARVFDSGDDFEAITAAELPAHFNASNTNNTFDDRSDNKGPEPEGVAVGSIDGRSYAFVGLERIGGVMAYDISDTQAPAFVQYYHDRDFGALPTGPDSGPEILRFVPADQSPTGRPMLVVGHEVSGTVSLLEAQ